MDTSSDHYDYTFIQQDRAGNDSRHEDSQGHPQSLITERRSQLSKIAQETLSLLEIMTPLLPSLNLSTSIAYRLEDLPELKTHYSPRFQSVSIDVLSKDSLNAAIDISQTLGNYSMAQRVAVLNMASSINPGGGWLNGALAQEEAICYRSSLSLSLHKSYYPTAPTAGIYTRDVVILRSDYASGHVVWNRPAAELPIVSVLSVAGLRRPKIKVTNCRATFANQNDRDITKNKMRLCLRMAAHNGHTRLVLGALGCGACRGPTTEIAQCWGEVFGESEFTGGWWERIIFAVLDTKDDGNFETFREVLGGMTV